jgi:hypothetical protein
VTGPLPCHLDDAGPSFAVLDQIFLKPVRGAVGNGVLVRVASILILLFDDVLQAGLDLPIPHDKAARDRLVQLVIVPHDLSLNVVAEGERDRSRKVILGLAE